MDQKNRVGLGSSSFILGWSTCYLENRQVYSNSLKLEANILHEIWGNVSTAIFMERNGHVYLTASASTFIKKGTPAQVFSVDFAKFLGTAVLQSTCNSGHGICIYFRVFFWLLLPKFNFWKRDWALSYFLNIFLFPEILSFMSFGNSWGNWYNKFAILDITFCFYL